jgi:hypothetical protein
MKLPAVILLVLTLELRHWRLIIQSVLQATRLAGRETSHQVTALPELFQP